MTMITTTMITTTTTTGGLVHPTFMTPLRFIALIACARPSSAEDVIASAATYSFFDDNDNGHEDVDGETGVSSLFSLACRGKCSSST